MACLIAAPCSGSGKTLLSLAISALLRRSGASVQVFKVGPDYLDPQLLGRVSGRPCRNLDRLLCGEEWLQRAFHWWGGQADHCLVEGVMGLFDGRGPSADGSSAEVATLLGLPVVLVVEASRQAGSLAALVRGFRDHQPGLELAGVVLNGVSTERHRALLSEALASIAMPLLGVLPRHPDLSLPSRHLGLLPPDELQGFQARSEEWAALAERNLDLERLLPLLAPPPPLTIGEGRTRDPIRWCLERIRPDPSRPGERRPQRGPAGRDRRRRRLPLPLPGGHGAAHGSWADPPALATPGRSTPAPGLSGGDSAGRLPRAARRRAGRQPAQPERPEARRRRRPADLRRVRRPAAAWPAAGGSPG